MRDLRDFDVKPEDLSAARYAEGFAPLMARQAERARAALRSAAAQLPAPQRAPAPGIILGALYETLLDELERSDFRVLHQRIALTPVRKLLIASRTWCSGRPRAVPWRDDRADEGLRPLGRHRAAGRAWRAQSKRLAWCSGHAGDAAPAIGGRARRVDLRIGDRDFAVDNGQHLLLGACSETIALMRRLGVDPHQTLLSLRSWSGIRTDAARSGLLAAPLHLAFGWPARAAYSGATASRWPPGSRASVAVGGSCPSTPRSRRCWRRQSDTMVRRLWRPLCIAAMNAEPAQASSQMFLNLLRPDPGSHRADSGCF